MSKEDQEAVNGLINVLSNLNSVSSTYSDVLADLETKQSLLSSAYKEMHDDGEVSVGTYQKLIDAGLNYSEAIDIANGKISVNVEKLKELTKEKAKDEILTLRLTKAEIEHNIALNPKDSSLYEDKARAIDEEIKAKQKALELLEGYDYTTTAKDSSTSSKKEDPQSVTDFEAEYARRQHEINMGRMEKDEDYYSWLLEAAHTAYDGLKDYESDLWKYEEEVYSGRKQLADDFYDEQQKDFEDRISALEDDIDKAKSDDYDNQIDVLTKQKETQDNIYDTLLKILDKYKDPDVTESNSNVWKTIGKDNENVKITDKGIAVKGTEIDTVSINGDKTKTDDKADDKDKTTTDSKNVFEEFLKSLGMTEPNIKKYMNGEFKNNLNGLMGIRQTASFTPKVDKGLSVEWGTLTKKEMSGNVAFNGDIVIQNPVGNSDDLAKELMADLPNAFQKQIYSNLAK